MALTSTFSTIAATQTAADKPLDTTLVDAMRQDIDVLYEWMGGPTYTPSTSHTHNGVNSASISLGSSSITEPMIASLAVTEAKLAASAVSQSKLKSTYGDVSVGSGVTSNVTLPGGTYGYYCQYWLSGTNPSGTAGIAQGFTTTSPITYALLGETGGGFEATTYARQYYVQASPPYDLGDGEIPLFVFVIVDSLGKIISTYIAPEAPWHYNGPTSLRPDSERTGKKYQSRRQLIAEHGSIKAARLAGLTRAQIMDRIATDPMVDIEITQAIKQADMPLIPHPFVGNNLTGKTVVMLDPVSPLMHSFFELHEHGESVTDIVRGWLTIGNTALARSGPPGVMVVSAALK